MPIQIEHKYKGIKPNQKEFVVPSGLISEKITSIKFEPVVINLMDDVGVHMLESLHEKIREANENGQPFIPFFIQSPGGDVYALMSIVEMIRQSKIPVYTIVTGFAASAAVCIFSCGEKRFMTKNAKLLIHDVSIDFGEDTSITTSNIKVEAKEMRHTNKTIFKIMAENIGKPPKFFVDIVKSKRHNDIYVDCNQALDWGLATHIGFPRFEVTTEISMDWYLNPSSGIMIDRYEYMNSLNNLSSETETKQPEKNIKKIKKPKHKRNNKKIPNSTVKTRSQLKKENNNLFNSNDSDFKSENSLDFTDDQSSKTKNKNKKSKKRKSSVSETSDIQPPPFKKIKLNKSSDNNEICYDVSNMVKKLKTMSKDFDSDESASDSDCTESESE